LTGNTHKPHGHSPNERFFTQSIGRGLAPAEKNHKLHGYTTNGLSKERTPTDVGANNTVTHRMSNALALTTHVSFTFCRRQNISNLLCLCTANISSKGSAFAYRVAVRQHITLPKATNKGNPLLCVPLFRLRRNSPLALLRTHKVFRSYAESDQRARGWIAFRKRKAPLLKKAGENFP